MSAICDAYWRIKCQNWLKFYDMRIALPFREQKFSRYVRNEKFSMSAMYCLRVQYQVC